MTRRKCPVTTTRKASSGNPKTLESKPRWVPKSTDHRRVMTVFITKRTRPRPARLRRSTATKLGNPTTPSTKGQYRISSQRAANIFRKRSSKVNADPSRVPNTNQI
ncbi:unnamed protein product [Acanthoscelides obtectus]|uniref:Uncharacterized protein n=1 Tax=Acanthoscelides obtectus TaxID=200917 RepID=A0A9P0LI96_ACAOB|nr:unnamed protein product [Acanthoscelides obtectus]CAK1664947.1 hypothetical protein AOBTE_LOCUS24571 [Acanthoscelides obtectus]